MKLPESYWGKMVDSTGVFEETKTHIRRVDHSDGTWYYGHDEIKGGKCWPWMRLRETVDRSSNDINQMTVIDGKWSLQT